MLTDSIGSPLLWTAFVVFVLAMLMLDLGVFHRKAHEVSVREAAIWSVVWVALALLFNVGVYIAFGAERALEFTTGYVIEKALAVDNIFVFVVIFSAFGIPAIYQHRVLFWGVLGALVMRAAFIFAGAAVLARFHWAIYVFGGILAVTGVKLLLQRNQKIHPERNPIVRLFQRLMPVTTQLTGDRFTIVQNGRRYATPLLLALVAVEVTDLIFAVDSIPADAAPGLRLSGIQRRSCRDSHDLRRADLGRARDRSVLGRSRSALFQQPGSGEDHLASPLGA